jgi:GNAT superfamily N-acetyltransferase
VSIRLAVGSEQCALEALQWRASLMNEAHREALLAHPDAIELPIAQIEAGRVFVAERDGAILGFSVVLPRNDGDAELDGLFVEPSAWRHGIGRKLVEAAGAFACSGGSSALYVIGDPHSAGFYYGCGFELLGKAETRFGPGLLMRKSLVGLPRLGNFGYDMNSS